MQNIKGFIHRFGVGDKDKGVDLRTQAKEVNKTLSINSCYMQGSFNFLFLHLTLLSDLKTLLFSL